MIDDDTMAMERRDKAAAAGAVICDECVGSGEVWKEVYVIDGWSVSGAQCPKCNGETWIDKDGKPYKID